MGEEGEEVRVGQADSPFWSLALNRIGIGMSNVTVSRGPVRRRLTEECPVAAPDHWLITAAGFTRLARAQDDDYMEVHTQVNLHETV